MIKVPEIVVASGKGGTGKTTLSSFLISSLALDGYLVVGVDADVEAPDLIIGLGGGREIDRGSIFDSTVAVINYDKCSLCGECYKACTYGAIKWLDKPIIIPELCEGCGVCKFVCPDNAINLMSTKTGDVIIKETKYAKIILGELEIGRKHSGKLVDMIRDKARGLVNNPDLIVIDAAAGTGCPVISSIVGSDYLIIVIEPTNQSLVGASKIIDIGKHFNIPIGLVVNKYNLNREFISSIKEWGAEKEVSILGFIPYDKLVVESYVKMIPLIEYAPKSNVVKELLETKEKILNELKVRGVLD